jgi:phosphoribosyl-ATP pyrophosphohydrolase
MHNKNYAPLDVLIAQIAQRQAQQDVTQSYTAQLLHAPVQKVAQKIIEEAGEVALAALAESDEALRSEMADLLYHLLVLCAHRNVSFGEVLATLQARQQQSGLAEKASRNQE